MCLVVVGAGELHRVRRHHRQLQARRQLHRGHHVHLVIGAAGTLQLQVEALRKGLGQLPRQLVRLRRAALQQRHTDRAGLRARQQDQAVGQFAQPVPLHHSLRLHQPARPGPRQQLRQVEVALPALHQQQHARQRFRVAAQPLQQDLGAQDRLDALLARRAVKLDGAEQIAQISDRQRRLLVQARGLDQFIDAHGAVNDRELAVDTQVDKHRVDQGAGAQGKTGLAAPSTAARRAGAGLWAMATRQEYTLPAPAAAAGLQSRSTASTSERNSREYSTIATSTAASISTAGEKNQPIAANEK